jgi:hypothetical protein
MGTNGGFTAVAYASFTGSIGSWERIFEFFSDFSGRLVFNRGGGTSYIEGHIVISGNYYSISVQTITQNQWSLFVFRSSSSILQIIKDSSVIQSASTSIPSSDLTVSSSYVGRSFFALDSYFTGNLVGLYTYDRYLSDTELEAIRLNLNSLTTAGMSTANCIVYHYTLLS